MCTVDDVEPLLERTDLTKLSFLGMCNAMFAQDLCDRLPMAKILASVERLDLSMGIVTDEAAAKLAANARAFAHLTEINVEANYISKKGAAALKKAFGNRVRGLEAQREVPPA